MAGGSGTRLSPITSIISKQLLLLFDKPMIYYPISTLMLCGIREILIITNESNSILFKELLGDGKRWGVNFSYAIQSKPEGVAQSILIGEEFIGKSSIALALGDNFFHGNNLSVLLEKGNKRSQGCTIFAYPVNNPERYGIVEFDQSGKVVSIVEKPVNKKGDHAVTGIYFYDNSVIERVKCLNFSDRGELEITSLNQNYLNDNSLNVEILRRGITWLDAGTFDSLHEASSYVRTLQKRQGLKIGCPEEIAWRKGWIKTHDLKQLAKNNLNKEYGRYLLKLSEDLSSIRN